MDFEVNRNNFHETQIVDEPAPDLGSGQIRLGIERFAFTTNNISYAVSGDMLGYWDFFPTTAPWGRLPAMGLSTVIESAHPEISAGGRYFGFHPMSDQLVIDARSAGAGFIDVGPHRANHADAYTGFLDVSSDPLFREDRVDEYLLLRGLFMTSFLVDDFLADNDFHGAGQTLVTSASSKTSIALAACLSRRGHRSVGLTSAGNREFTESLGLYDQVITYDEIEDLDPTPSTVVDMAGNADVRSRVHDHFGDSLRYSCQVGATHWEELQGGPEPLPGPRPEFFFAPAQIAKRNNDWGPGEVMTRIGVALGEFLEGSPRWLTVEHSTGPDAITEVYRQLLEGRADPSIGHVVSMSDSTIG